MACLTRGSRQPNVVDTSSQASKSDLLALRTIDRRVNLSMLESTTPQSRIPLGGSSGVATRAHGLRSYLSDLHAALELGLERSLTPVRLLVLTQEDWTSAAPYPYGFTFFRRLRDGSGVIFAPANYPGNLLWVFRAVVMKSQLSAPGSVEEFLDYTLGHELGHAAADQSGIRTRVRWLDEFLATYLYLCALKSARPEALQKILRWGEIFASSNLDCALADPALTKPGGSRGRVTRRRNERAGDVRLERTDLGAFEYPLVRLPLANQAWYQARFTLYAAELMERRGWDFANDAIAALSQVSGRGGVSRVLVRLEPGFREWFRSFGDA